MTGRMILAALLSRPSLVRNVGDIKVKQLMAAGQSEPEAAGGVARSSFRSFRDAGPAADAAEHDGEGEA